MKPESFGNKTPAFYPEQYFLGHTKGYGQFWDSSAKLSTQFTVDLDGTLNRKTLVLKEVLKYESGEIQNRIYNITKLDDHHYRIDCDDLEGPGTIEAFGNALRWSYHLKQKVNDSQWIFTGDDWMFLQQDGVMLNRAFLSKWGLAVGEVFMATVKK